MKKLSIVLAVCLLASSAWGRSKAQGFCSQGGHTVTLAGMNSSTLTDQSYPSCTVTVYLAGTTTPATLYADNSGTTKSYTFTADTNGYWFFYADNGRYDIRFSGGGITTPWTQGDYLLCDPQDNTGSFSCKPSTGGGGSPAPPTNSIQFNNSGSFGGSSFNLWDDVNDQQQIGQPNVSGLDTNISPWLDVAYGLQIIGLQGYPGTGIQVVGGSQFLIGNQSDDLNGGVSIEEMALGSADIGTSIGLGVKVSNHTASKTLGSAEAIHVLTPDNDGTITEADGIWIDDQAPHASGTTLGVGLHIASQGNSSDTNYAIVTEVGIVAHHDDVIIDGDLQINATGDGRSNTCTSAQRGKFRLNQGTPDSLQMCMHKSDNSYAFVTIFTAP